MEWQFLQGAKAVTGPLIGGCTDVLPMIVASSVWPENAWNNAVLFLENSEDAISPDVFLYTLRNLGAQGILERISGLILPAHAVSSLKISGNMMIC